MSEGNKNPEEVERPELDVPTVTANHLRYDQFSASKIVYDKRPGFVYDLTEKNIEERKKVLRDHVDMIGIYRVNSMKLHINVAKAARLVGVPLLPSIYGKYWKRLYEQANPGEMKRKMRIEGERRAVRAEAKAMWNKMLFEKGKHFKMLKKLI